MGGRLLLASTLVAVTLGTAGCRKEKKPPPAPPLSVGQELADDTNDEGLRLCREVYPCKNKGPDPYGVGFCAKEAKPAEPAEVPFTAGDLRLVATHCHIRNGDMLDIVGVASTGEHLRGRELFTHVRGTSRERAFAASLLLGFGDEPPLAVDAKGGDCSPHDADGWLSFCKRSTWGTTSCRARPDGLLTCSKLDEGRAVLDVCERHPSGRGLALREAEEIIHPPDEEERYSPSHGIPSNEGIRFEPNNHTTVRIPIRARGLSIHHGSCVYDGELRLSRLRWGTDAAGKLVHEQDLLPRLDGPLARAALLNDRVSKKVTWLLTEPTTRTGANPDGASCEFPPGPREDHDVLTYYAIEEWTRLLRCDYRTSDYTGQCAAVTPRERFCL